MNYHTCPNCQQRFPTYAERLFHVCNGQESVVQAEAPWTEAPSYALIYMNETTEAQGIVRQSDDVSLLISHRDIWTSIGFYNNAVVHYGVICQAPDVQADQDAALLADIAALTGADIAAGF